MSASVRKVLLMLAAKAVLAGQILVALVWVVVSARGFPVAHPMFWGGVGLPAVLVVASLVALFGPKRLAEGVLLALPAGWGAAGLSFLLVFLDTGGPVGLLCLGGAVVTGVLAAGIVGRPEDLRIAALLVFLAVLAGAGAAPSQRGPAATTRPAGGSMETSPSVPRTFEAGALWLHLNPALEFVSVSPDRFWTVFARGPTPATACTEREQPAPGQLALDVRCRVAEATWSHLNHWTTFEVNGHSDLAVSFSPMPDVVVPVEPFDYPVGRPATFAWLGDDGRLRLSRARSAEKGPFEELGSGPLGPDEPLVVTLHDAGQPVLEIELADFAAQASTALSPTAGWGVAQNAIEFVRLYERSDAPATFWVTLAGTSVGRGFQSVGHAPGVYRNRVSVRSL